MTSVLIGLAAFMWVACITLLLRLFRDSDLDDQTEKSAAESADKTKPASLVR